MNCLNGILGAFIDNIPLIVISGQPRNDICASSINKELRQYGDQEFSRISEVVKNIVKRSIKLTLKNDLELELSKFYQTAITGRPGPVWIDVPMEVQKEKFVKKNFFINKKVNNTKDPEVTNTQIDIIIDKILKSKRPIIYAGTDINTFNCRDDFIKLIHQLKIPVVTEWNNHDLIDGSNLFVGRPGLRGDRKGNIIVYKSDLIISIGSNLSVRQVGDKPNKFSPNSFKIMVNIDSVEKSKPNLEIDLFIKSRIDSFVLKLKNKTKRQFYQKSFSRWLKWCNNLKHQL